MNNPKFERKIDQKVVKPASDQALTSGYGVILAYHKDSNTANVQMTNKNSIEAGRIYNNVPCPTSIGVQGVAPAPGRPVFVDFHGTSDYMPIIVSIFNPYYYEIDNTTQNASVNNIPRYITST